MPGWCLFRSAKPVNVWMPVNIRKPLLLVLRVIKAIMFSSPRRGVDWVLMGNLVHGLVAIFLMVHRGRSMLVHRGLVHRWLVHRWLVHRWLVHRGLVHRWLVVRRSNPDGSRSREECVAMIEKSAASHSDRPNQNIISSVNTGASRVGALYGLRHGLYDGVVYVCCHRGSCSRRPWCVTGLRKRDDCGGMERCGKPSQVKVNR